MIRIENKKTYHGDGIYVGRPSLLGNPFRIGQHGTREEVIQQYRAWLWRQIKRRGEVYEELRRLAAKAKQDDLVLICWCKKPGHEIPCHADVLRASIEWINRQNSSVLAPHAAMMPELRQPLEAKNAARYIATSKLDPKREGSLELWPKVQGFLVALLGEPV